MKIVQISKNTLPVPPVDYGGAQRDIYYLTEELIRRGHEVILFAKKGSKTSGVTYEYPSDDPKEQLDFIIRHTPPDTDIIHDHYGIAAKADPPIPTIRNSHYRAGIKAQIPVYVSRTILRTGGKNKGYYVHNGIRLKDYRFRERKGKYLLFLGRLTRTKGVHLAIEVARKTGRKLIIAGPARGGKEQKYFRKHVRPHLGSQISYVGSVGGKVKQDLLSKAYCVLFPSTWNEPFGLVPIEALACGTPVLALRSGAVPEVLKGLPELLCKDTNEMIRKIRGGKFPSPRACRRYVVKRFSDKRMADGFLKLYRKVLREKKYKLVRDSEWSRRAQRLRRQIHDQEV